MVETRCQILEVQQKVSHNIGAKDAGIFDAHLLVLEDPALVDEVTRLIQEEKVNGRVRLPFRRREIHERAGFDRG